MSQTKDLEALWRGVFGEPPCIQAEAPVLVRILVEALPAAPPYQAAPPDVRREGSAAEAIYLAATKP